MRKVPRTGRFQIGGPASWRSHAVSGPWVVKERDFHDLFIAALT